MPEDNDIDPFHLGVAFGLGFEMGKDEYEFRGIPNGEEDEPEDTVEEGVIEKIPLTDRFGSKNGRKKRPFLRWLDQVRSGVKTHADEIDYTKDELWKILQEEGNSEEWHS